MAKKPVKVWIITFIWDEGTITAQVDSNSFKYGKSAEYAFVAAYQRLDQQVLRIESFNHETETWERNLDEWKLPKNTQWLKWSQEGDFVPTIEHGRLKCDQFMIDQKEL